MRLCWSLFNAVRYFLTSILFRFMYAVDWLIAKGMRPNTSTSVCVVPSSEPSIGRRAFDRNKAWAFLTEKGPSSMHASPSPKFSPISRFLVVTIIDLVACNLLGR